MHVHACALEIRTRCALEIRTKSARFGKNKNGPGWRAVPRSSAPDSTVYTYKRVVCVYLFACLSVFFLSATRHLSTLRRCLRVAERAGSGAVVAGGPARRARASMHSESTRAHAVQLLNEKIAVLMPFKNIIVRARA